MDYWEWGRVYYCINMKWLPRRSWISKLKETGDFLYILYLIEKIIRMAQLPLKQMRRLD
jgi:hypothetical protein